MEQRRKTREASLGDQAAAAAGKSKERRGGRARKETEAGAAAKSVEGREFKAGVTIRERTTRQGTAGQDDICSIFHI